MVIAGQSLSADNDRLSCIVALQPEVIATGGGTGSTRSERWSGWLRSPCNGCRQATPLPGKVFTE